MPGPIDDARRQYVDRHDARHYAPESMPRGKDADGEGLTARVEFRCTDDQKDRYSLAAKAWADSVFRQTGVRLKGKLVSHWARTICDSAAAQALSAVGSPGPTRVAHERPVTRRRKKQQ